MAAQGPEQHILKIFSTRAQSVSLVLIGLGGFAATVIGGMSLAQHYVNRQARLVVAPIVEQVNAIHLEQERRVEVLETQVAIHQATAAELLEQVQTLRAVLKLERVDYGAMRERVRRAAEFDRKVNAGVPGPPPGPPVVIRLPPAE